MDRKYAAPNTNTKFFFCTHYYATDCQFCPEGLLFNEFCQTCIRKGENCFTPQTTRAAKPSKAISETTTTTTQAVPPPTATKLTTVIPVSNCEFIHFLNNFSKKYSK